jgi:hypothetical protein
MKFAAFDLETWKETPPDDHNLKKYRPLGISCAAVWLSGTYEPLVWYRHPSGILRDISAENDPGPYPMLQGECRDLVRFLKGCLDNGYVPLTWNGLQFDFDILAEESGLFGECRELALASVDMMFHFYRVKGYPLGLEAVTIGLGIGRKTEGVHGDVAPVLWAKGPDERQLVLRYVANDARMTLDVAETTSKRGGFSWTSRGGRINTFRLGEEGWLTVREALHLPDPNQSWMTSPLPLSQFMDWMEVKK